MMTCPTQALLAPLDGNEMVWHRKGFLSKKNEKEKTRARHEIKGKQNKSSRRSTSRIN